MRYFHTFTANCVAPTVNLAPPFMVKSSHNSQPGQPATFEAALAELEAIVRNLETGQLPLEESLAAYERGSGLLKHCRETLAAAEQKLLILENDGLLEFEPSSGKLASDEQEA